MITSNQNFKPAVAIFRWTDYIKSDIIKKNIRTTFCEGGSSYLNNMIALSFFTGAGGLDMGIHRAGFDVKLCVEIEEKYCNTLKRNHPEWNVKSGNIMDYDKDKVFMDANIEADTEIDLIIGGSPCQSFSTAGNRRGFEDARGQAMLKYADLIEEIKPKVFLLENVRGLLSAALKHRRISERGSEFSPLSTEEIHGSALDYLLGRFKSYDVKVKLINAADYGVAQKRERVFIIGVRKDVGKEFAYPEASHNRLGNHGKHKWVSVSDVFKQMEQKNIQHKYVTYSEDRMKYMKMIPEGGGNWRNLPKDIAVEAMGGAYASGGGKVGFFRRIKINEPAPTLLTSPIQKSTNLGHPFEDRPLSINEYLAIQGFPEDYFLEGTLNDQYTQIGNAVPVELAYVMGNAIYHLLK